jgi:hypothetical protein
MSCLLAQIVIKQENNIPEIYVSQYEVSSSYFAAVGCLDLDKSIHKLMK